MNAFFNLQFSYLLIAWMCLSRPLNNEISRLDERCLRLIYNNKRLTFEEFLQKNDPVLIHIRNLQTPTNEMCKVINGSSLEIMKMIFRIREENGYNLRN